MFLNYALVAAKDKLDEWDQMIDDWLFVYRITVSRVLNNNPFFILETRLAKVTQYIEVKWTIESRRWLLLLAQTFQKSLI